jgi:hypothetical protein
MESENKNSRLTQQITSLRSGNKRAILSTISELRSEGDISVLPILFDIMIDQDDQEILLGISALLNDLKDKAATEILVEAIANSEYQEILTPLVAACWQNGLSYGKQITTFVDVVVTGAYSAAIEAFTVIEEAVGELEQEERVQLIRTLKFKLKEVNDQKRVLLEELIKVVESY